MKLTSDDITRAGLRLLNEVGLDGLTMRLVAKELGVQAPALYWHLKNKQELLDAMARVLFRQAVEGLEAPRRGVGWRRWLTDLAHRTRRTILRYRDGARVYAGSSVHDPALYRMIELTLATLTDAGFTERQAVRGVTALLHYTVGFTIEEQARLGTAYGADNPYEPGRIAARIDAERYPLTARALPYLFADDTDAEFDDGLRTVLDGMAARLKPARQPPNSAEIRPGPGGAGAGRGRR